MTGTVDLAKSCRAVRFRISSAVCRLSVTVGLNNNYSSVTSLGTKGKIGKELTHGGRNGAPSLWAIQTSGARLFLRGPGVDAPRGTAVTFWRLFLTMVIFHVVMQQLGFTEWLCAARSAALERVVIKIDGQDRRRLVFDNSIHWNRTTEAKGVKKKKTFLKPARDYRIWLKNVQMYSHGSLLNLLGLWKPCFLTAVKDKWKPRSHAARYSNH